MADSEDKAPDAKTGDAGAKDDGDKNKGKDRGKGVWAFLRYNLTTAIVGATVGFVIATAAFAWEFITRGGLIEALGGVSARNGELPSDALLVVTSAGCPRGWIIFENGKGHVLLGAGEGRLANGAAATPRAVGSKGGSEVHAITVAELPPHFHQGRTNNAETTQTPRSVTAPVFDTTRVAGGGPANQQRVVPSSKPGERVTLSIVEHQHTFRTDGGTGLTGKPAPDNNMPPWIAVTFCVRESN
jgi:microcystin-dependent protein